MKLEQLPKVQLKELTFDFVEDRYHMSKERESYDQEALL